MDPEGPLDCFCPLSSLSADGSAAWNRFPVRVAGNVLALFIQRVSPFVESPRKIPTGSGFLPKSGIQAFKAKAPGERRFKKE